MQKIYFFQKGHSKQKSNATKQDVFLFATLRYFLQPNVFFQPFNNTSSLPYSILVALYPMPPNNDIPGLHMLFYILFILAAVVNQVIYVFSNSFYKKAFQEAFKKDFTPRNPFEKRSYVFHIDRSHIVQ